MSSEVTLGEITQILLHRNDDGIDQLRMRFHRFFLLDEQKIAWMNKPNTYLGEQDEQLKGMTPIDAVRQGKARQVLKALEAQIRKEPTLRNSLKKASA